MKSRLLFLVMGLLTCPAWAQSPSPDLRGIYIYTNGLRSQSATDLAALSASFTIPGVDGVAVVVGWGDVEPDVGTYDWTLLDQWIGQVIALGKKIDLVVPAGSNTPKWLFKPPPAGAGATELSFTVSPHDGETGFCESTSIAAPWDPAFFAQWDAMLAALSAHLKSAGTYSAITLVRLTGINRSGGSEELRLPAETAQSSGLPCVTDAIATWQQAGYRPSLLLQAWNAVIGSFEKSFPDKSFAVSVINPPNAFPPIDENGAVITGTPPDATQPLLLSASQMFPGRLVVQLDFLMPGQAASTEVTNAAQNLGTLAAFQTNEYLGGDSGGDSGAACAGPNTDPTPCTDATFLALLETGIYPLGQSNPLRSQYIEVFHVNAAAFPDDILQAHFQLVPPSACDVNLDGNINVLDVQIMINEALGVDPPLNDLNADGVVNVVDVQITVNGAFQLGCSTGSQLGAGGNSFRQPRTAAQSGSALASLAIAARPYSATDLGTLGGSSATAYGINNLGQVVGSSETAQAASHTFLWEAGHMTDLGLLDDAAARNSVAYGINDASQIAGVYLYPDRDTASFFYTAGVANTLTQVPHGRAAAINNIGEIVGDLSRETGSSFEAFLWNAGTAIPLGTLGGARSQARAINDSGQVAGFADLDGNSATHAFLYSGWGLADLGTLGGGNSMAFGINRTGQIVGASRTPGNGPQHAFLYSAGAMTDLGTLGGTESLADGINGSGLVVGWSRTAGGEQHAFLWSSGRMIDVNSFAALGPGVWLEEATAVNDVGQIVANANNGHAYLIALPAQLQ